MSTAHPLPSAVEAFLAAIKAEQNDWPSNNFKRLAKALAPIKVEIIQALADGPCREVGGWLEFTVRPHPKFSAPGYTAGSPLPIAYSLKSDRFTTSVKVQLHFGLVDLCRFIWRVRAPDQRPEAELRLYALIGRAYVQAFAAETRKLAKEAA